MCQKIASCGMAMFAVMASASVFAAEDAGFYLGAGVGEARNTVAEAGFDGNDTAFKVIVGYAFNKYFATELAYVDAGTAEDDIGPFNVQIEASGVIASLVGTIPIGENFGLFAKAGVAFSDAEQTIRQGNLRETESDSESDFAYALGAALNFGRFALRAEYEEVVVSDGRFDALFVSALFKF